jgi:hypothetical protein
VYYVVALEGTGSRGSMALRERYVAAVPDTAGRVHYTSWWPALVDSVRGTVAGVDSLGRVGAWADTTAWLELGGAP